MCIFSLTTSPRFVRRPLMMLVGGMTIPPKELSPAEPRHCRLFSVLELQCRGKRCQTTCNPKSDEVGTRYLARSGKLNVAPSKPGRG